MSRNLLSLDIPCGHGGLNASRSPARVRPIDLVAMESLTFEHDTWEKDGGVSKFNTVQISSAPSVIALHDFFTSALVQELVCATSDGRYLVLGTGGVSKTLKTGAGTDKHTVLVEGYNGTTKSLYIVNGNIAMQEYTGGASTADIAAPPADWTGGKPTWAFLHRGRMYAGGNTNQPDGVYASILNNHSDYTGSGNLFFRVYPGEGERIVGGISWRERAYIWKYPKGIYVLDDASTNTADWGWKRISRYVGGIGPSAILEADDEVYFVSPDVFIHALSAVQEFGDVMSSAILPMELGTYIRENVNFSRLARVVSAYYAKKRKICFGFSGPASSVNNVIIGLDIHRTLGQVKDYQPFASLRDKSQSLVIRRDPSSQQNDLLAGTDDGYVYKLDTEARSKDGAGYSSFFETKDNDLFPNGQRRGNLRELEVSFVPSGNHNLTLSVYSDGDLGDPITMSLIGVGGILDSFILDTDVLGTDVLQNGRGRLFGDARRVRIKGENNEPDESFSIANLAVKFTPGSDR